MSSTTVATSRRPLTMRARHLAAARGVRLRGADGHGDRAVGERTAQPTVEQPRGCAFPVGRPGRDVTPAALRALQRTLATKLDGLVPTSGNPAVSLLVQEVGAHRVVLMVCGRQVERTVFAEWPNVFWIAVLGDPRGRWPSACPVSQAEVLSCLLENAASAVLFNRGARKSCARGAGYAAHRPEAQRRRREAYRAQVKTVYPRAKVATRTRRARRQ